MCGRSMKMYHFDASETYDGEKFDFAIAVTAATLFDATMQIKERYPDAKLELTDIHEVTVEDDPYIQDEIDLTK